MKIVFAFNSYGLGHATRTLPIVRESIRQGHETYIVAFSRSLEFLQKELGSNVEKYFELRDYSFSKVFNEKKFSAKKFFFYTPFFLQEVKLEHKAFQKLHAQYKFDVVFSDARPGIYVKGIPSFFMTNQIKVGQKGFNLASEIMTEKYNVSVKKKFKKIIVPDTEYNSISGEITHNLRFLKPEDVQYIGILSMLEKKEVAQDIDYFFSISGPEPQRTVLEKKLMEDITKLNDKKVVVTLGKPEMADYVEQKGNITIYGLLDRQKQTEIMNRAKLVITRSGYSTVMDLAELDKKALLIPTKGQPEQEYLAKYHLKNGNYYAVNLEELKLPEDLLKALDYPGYKPEYKTAESVSRCLKLITS